MAQVGRRRRVAPATTGAPEGVGTGGSTRRSLAHLPGLDGYRGLAVAAVVAFHADVVPGGWLGVDVFFVLSGFLITRLLVHEHAAHGSIALGRFWRRRGRRLLPALVAFLAGVAAYAWWYPDPDRLPADLTGQMAATVAYVANWFQLAAGHGYWDQYAAPSPLEHMWSLAIEEQFYVLFPLVVVAVVAVVARTGRRHLLGAVLALGALASWTDALLRLRAGDGFERVYLGTDTRIAAILCGATAAWALTIPGWRPHLERAARATAVPALVLVVALSVGLDGDVRWTAARWTWLIAFELAVAVLLVATTARAGAPTAVDRVAELRVLGWLGAISYGLYLWHVPILLVAERQLPDWPRAIVVAVGVALSLGVAQVSAAVLELPIRRRGLAVAPRFVLAGVGVAVVAASLAVTHRATAQARADRDARSADGAQEQLVEAPEGAGADEPLVAAGEPRSLPLDRPDDRAPRVLLVGDSMARDLTPGFDETARTLDVVPSEASFVGCGVGGLDVADDPGLFNTPEYAAECAAWLETFPDLVATSRPDVVVLMRATARRTIPPDPTRVDPCSAAYGDWYRGALAEEVEALSSTGATVAVATRPFARFGDVVDDAVDDETECVNRWSAEAVAELPEAVVLPVADWVCPDQADRRCVDEVDGVTLRPDGLHFRDEGATVATRWIVDQLFGP